MGNRLYKNIEARGNKFYVRIWKDNKPHYVCSFPNLVSAINAHKAKEIELYGSTREKLLPVFENGLVKIPLSSSGRHIGNNYAKHYAIIDKKDYDKIKGYSWSLSRGYVCTKDGVKLHQLIIGKGGDHKSGDKLDNRRFNLRHSNHSENARNSKKPFHTTGYHKNTSKFKGVTKRKNYDRYRARIRIGKITISLGYYETEIEAARAYDKKAKELFGEFACVNFPEPGERCAIR